MTLFNLDEDPGLLQARAASGPDSLAEGIIRALPDAALLVTAAGEIRLANSAAARLFRTSPAHLRESCLMDHLADAPADVARYLAACARTGSPLPGALHPRAADADAGLHKGHASRLPVAGSAVRATGQGEPALILLRFRDATGMDNRFILLNQRLVELTHEVRARRAAVAAAERARALAEHANQAKSDFLAVMSHELRTPLNAIGGYVEILELEIRGPLTTAQREDLGRIQRAQRHLLMLINEVLNFARLEAGHVDYNLAPVTLDRLLRSIEPLIAPQVLAQGLRYRYEPSADELVVMADSEKLEQILLNLLSNAIKFTQPNGLVTLACESDAEWVRIVVRDTGVGIAPEKLASVFEPFVQLDQTLTRASDGVGLGLAISRDLARGMSGDLTAASVAGVGSTFVIRLPLAR